MKIAIGADHRGAVQKKFIQETLRAKNKDIEWIDVGCEASEPQCEYPTYAQLVCEALQSKKVDAGILLCGSGVGMAIAANRYKSIYAALVWNTETARLSKEHDNANILVIGSDFVSDEQAVAMIDAWLSAKFQGGRYQRRIDMIDKLGGI